MTDDARAFAKALRLLGLGVRGRLAVIGVERVRAAALDGSLRVAVVAQDVSQNSLDKVLPLLAAKRVKVFEAPSAAELGHAVGRQTTAVVGVLDPNLARGIRDVLAGRAI